MARDLTSMDDLPTIVRKDFTDAGAACADIEPEAFANLGGFDVMIGTMRLIGVPCGMGGAYNQPYALYAGYDLIIERISFPVMRDGKPAIVTTAYNIDLDPVKGVLTSFFKGRGLGDCGQYFTWKLDEASNSLEMIEERARGECEGAEGGPDTFPVVFQAKP